MSESRDALLARFRATLLMRVLRVAELFDDGRQEALAELHTLKGEARMLGLSRLATLAHELETSVDERGFGADWSRALDEMRLVLQENVPPTLSADPPLAQVQLEPILRELSRHALELAEHAGKALRVEVRAEGVQLPRAFLDLLCPALLHLLQNAVDHGLEPPQERGGKPELGRLELGAQVRGAEVVLTVADDGRGIDPETIRATAALRGLAGARALGELELLELLFEPGFSTRSDVTLLSGRGVGLDVVRRNVLALGGQIAIETQLGRGTRFVLSMPVG